jgi:peptidoglycan/xylan/chitin deacetylase (PgdA/CDA1 family)
MFIKKQLRLFYKYIQHGCIVLCYHRVGKLTTDHWQNAVSVDNFREHLRVVKRYYHPTSMSELVESSKMGKLPDRRTIVVTFDDGYASDLEYACESLTDNNIPAIFYVNTYSLDRDRNFWWDELQKMLIDAPIPEGSIKLSVLSHEFSLPFQTSGQRENSFFILHRILKGLDFPTREHLLSDLGKQVNGKEPDALSAERKPFNSRDIEFLVQTSYFEIGGHGHYHRALSLLNHDEQQYEIQENKKILEAITQKPIVHFSYPFGGIEDFDETTIKIVKQCGYESAVTMIKEPFRLQGDLFGIPRISIKNWDAVKFKDKLDQLWAL